MRELSYEEAEVLQALTVAWNKYISLKKIHPSDEPEFMAAIHAAENIVMSRPATELRFHQSQEAGDQAPQVETKKAGGLTYNIPIRLKTVMQRLRLISEGNENIIIFNDEDTDALEIKNNITGLRAQRDYYQREGNRLRAIMEQQSDTISTLIGIAAGVDPSPHLSSQVAPELKKVETLLRESISIRRLVRELESSLTIVETDGKELKREVDQYADLIRRKDNILDALEEIAGGDLTAKIPE